MTVIDLCISSRDASLNAEDMASQSVRLKEEQLRKEEEKVMQCIQVAAASSPEDWQFGLAPWDWTQGATRDPRKESRIVEQGGSLAQPGGKTGTSPTGRCLILHSLFFILNFFLYISTCFFFFLDLFNYRLIPIHQCLDKPYHLKQSFTVYYLTSVDQCLLLLHKVGLYD